VPTLGEILLGVIDDLIRADRTGKLHVPRAGHGGDVRDVLATGDGGEELVLEPRREEGRQVWILE